MWTSWDGTIWLVRFLRVLGDIPWLRSQTRDIVFWLAWRSSRHANKNKSRKKVLSCLFLECSRVVYTKTIIHLRLCECKVSPVLNPNPYSIENSTQYCISLFLYSLHLRRIIVKYSRSPSISQFTYMESLTMSSVTIKVELRTLKVHKGLFHSHSLIHTFCRTRDEPRLLSRL